MKKNKLSNSQIRLYTECPRKYFYHYKKRLRPKEYRAFFLYGSAIDFGLNHLLKTKNLEEAIQKFDKSFRYNDVNGEDIYIPEATMIVYAKTDFDEELLLKEDYEKFEELKAKLNYQSTKTLKEILDTILEMKATIGFRNLPIEEKKLYSMANWLSLRRKGHIMIKSYAEKVLPRIKEVIAIQKRTKLENNNGDVVNGILDLVVLWEDDKRYLGDNKTSARDYEEDAASKSQQLIGYYHAEKEELKLDGVAFFVMYKNIVKNRIKICSKCGYDGTGGRHKTCNNAIGLAEPSPAGVPRFERCNGEWNETITPECKIDIILDKVSETAENLVLETFDKANEGITNEHFGPNLNACGSGEYRCPYYNKCWYGIDDDLIELEDKRKKD